MRENFEGRSNEIIAKFEKKMREGSDLKFYVFSQETNFQSSEIRLLLSGILERANFKIMIRTWYSGTP